MVDNIEVDSRFGRVIGGLETYLISITPVSFHILVNVTSPSTVWCKVIEQDERLKEEKVMAEKCQFGLEAFPPTNRNVNLFLI